jgi:UDP-N-acetylglucosamine 2-epimerase (non-hydrolysing)
VNSDRLKAKRIVCIFGTRPEAIKMAPVVLKLRERRSEFRTDVLVTAQHRGMLDGVLNLFRIRPRWDLNLMKPGQTLTDVAAGVLRGLDPLLARARPDLVLVHGDTTTTFAAATAAFHLGIPVGHVEAGLRSGDWANPFPEEMNRRLTDSLSLLHFAPTRSARENLLRENARPRGIFVTGNTGIDALRLGLNLSSQERPLSGLGVGPIVLITAHRRENFGTPLLNLCRAVREAAARRRDACFVYPVHPNPNVAGIVRKRLGGLPNVRLTPPMEYGSFIGLLKRAMFVVTDSGGLQEEAPSLGKPVLVFRKVTERPEAVRAGTVRLVGSEAGDIRRSILSLLEGGTAFRKMANAVNPYGDGQAAERTVQALRHHFGFQVNRPADFRG